MGVRSWLGFREKRTDETPEQLFEQAFEDREDYEQSVLRSACGLIDALNQLIPELPRGYSLWMTWRPARLTLVERVPGENLILRGDGIHRLHFER
jgi:hypothetical protein